MKWLIFSRKQSFRQMLSFFLVPLLVFMIFSKVLGQTTETYQGTVTIKSYIDWSKIQSSIKNTQISERIPRITLRTSYYVEGTGKHESRLSEIGTWGACGDGSFVFGYDCKSMEEIHSKVNSLLAQADIQLANPNDCPDKVPCVIYSNVPLETPFNFKVGNIDIGVNPKIYRDNLSAEDRLIEGVFLSNATLLTQGKNNSIKIPGYQAELFIHIVESLRLEDHHKGTVGLFVPEIYRKRYTSQRLKMLGSPYPSNTNRYVILIGYDDLYDADNVAETIAHEIGHALGLEHNYFDVDGNIMNSKGLGNTDFSQDQINKMQAGVSNFRRYGVAVSSYKKLCSKAY